MNRKGFTLVELLVVIVIIGIISFMGFPQLMRVITETNAKKEFGYYGDSMVNAAKVYLKKELSDLKEGNYFDNPDGYDIPLEKLIMEEYINAPNNTFSKKGMTCDGEHAKVNVKYVDTVYKYSYVLTCQDTSTKKKYTKTVNDEEFQVSDLQ